MSATASKPKPTLQVVHDPEPTTAAVEVSNLTKRYGDLVAVDEVSFRLDSGQAFALLGPNGSGKTSTVECLQGLRSPDSGTVRLLGLDPDTDRGYRRVHRRSYDPDQGVRRWNKQDRLADN